ncbi:MAG: chemotaxis protein CheW [Acidobacteriota bacterium]|nr:chemotaxis protein CheW [Acidobacteriota bacterium]
MKSSTAHLPSVTALHKADERAGKYLSFRLGKDEFAIQVLRVREIMGLQEVTVVAQTPAYLKGVMSLRGRAIPVIDLKIKLGMPESEPSARTSTVVVHVESEGGRLLMGIVVDAIAEVLTLKSGEFENPVPAGYEMLAPFLLGVAKIKGRAKFLLDINLVLTPHELHNLEAVLV